MPSNTINKNISDFISNNLILKNNKIGPKVCHDQKVCEIKSSKGKFSIPKKNEWPRDQINGHANRRIVLVLESPHIKEFESNPPQPAMGFTGDKIYLHLGKKLSSLSQRLEDGRYDLILVNAIRLQCSMGVATKYFRDIAFIGLWFEGKKDNFMDRLKALELTKDDLVINCCTLGNTSQFKGLFGRSCTQKALRQILSNDSINYKVKDGLRKLVADAITDVLIHAPDNKKFKQHSLHHPSSWK